MSSMIRCDKCRSLMYADSRSNKGAYAEIRIKYTDGDTGYHLCKKCLRQFYAEFMMDMTPEEFDEAYGSVDGVCGIEEWKNDQT